MHCTILNPDSKIYTKPRHTPSVQVIRERAGSYIQRLMLISFEKDKRQNHMAAMNLDTTAAGCKYGTPVGLVGL